jgi:hypothetical protein
VLDINIKSGAGATAVEGDALALLQERYRLLSELDKAMSSSREGRDLPRKTKPGTARTRLASLACLPGT